MSRTRIIRKDEKGLFIKVSGFKARPVGGTRYWEGCKVNAYVNSQSKASFLTRWIDHVYVDVGKANKYGAGHYKEEWKSDEYYLSDEEDEEDEEA